MPGTKKSGHVSSTGSIERRRGRRFSLRLSCRVCPASMEKVEFAGTVVNISRSGILVALDSSKVAGVLRPGEAVFVMVDLPRHPLFSPRCLECTAKIVRIVAAKTQTQVAVEIGQVQVTDKNTKGPTMPDSFGAPIEGLIQ